MCGKSIPATAGERPVINLLLLRKIPLGTVVLLFLCALAGVISGTLASPSVVDPKVFNIIWTVIYLVVFLVYCIWVFRFQRSDLDSLWPFLVLIIFSGLFFYSSFSAIDLGFAASFMSATRRVLMLFCWVFMAATIYRQKLSVSLFFGAENLLFSQFPAIVGYLIEVSRPSLDSFETSLANIAATAVMALILVVGIVIVLMRHRSPKGAPANVKRPGDTAEQTMGSIADNYALSPREAEIALLIIKGYTLPMISEKLFISTDTVRSHSKKLYKKLGIHKKRELITLVEQYE